MKLCKYSHNRFFLALGKKNKNKNLRGKVRL